jgi:murein DD-endopeptidase MepM/ murein hydrolase activator NlpD
MLFGVGRRGAFDLHTVPGILRTGVAAGAVWGLGMMVVGLVMEKQQEPQRAGTGEGVSTSATALLFPVIGLAPDAVREGFLAARGLRRHEALDIAAPRGTPVRAAADGHVRLTNRGGAGLTVEQDEASGRYCLVYAHLERYAPGLADAAVVTRGQVLGYVGTSGNAPPNVPHLHFAVHLRAGGGCWSGAAVDPVPLFGG